VKVLKAGLVCGLLLAVCAYGVAYKKVIPVKM